VWRDLLGEIGLDVGRDDAKRIDEHFQLAGVSDELPRQLGIPLCQGSCRIARAA